jgi:hypothetical protein
MGHLSHIKRRPRFRTEVDVRFGLGAGVVCVDETRTFTGRWQSATCRQVERTTAFALGAGTLCADETWATRGVWSGPICRETDISIHYGLTPAALCADESYAFRASWKQAVCNQVEKATGFALGNGHVLCADDQVIEVIDVRRFHGIWTTPRCAEEWQEPAALPVLGYSRHWGSSVDADSKTLHVELITRSASAAGYFARVRFSNGLAPTVWIPAGAAGRKFTVAGTTHGDTGTSSQYLYTVTATLPAGTDYALAADVPKTMSVTFTIGIHPGGVGSPTTT